MLHNICYLSNSSILEVRLLAPILKIIQVSQYIAIITKILYNINTLYYYQQEIFNNVFQLEL